jgi:hypothetical protein
MFALVSSAPFDCNRSTHYLFKLVFFQSTDKNILLAIQAQLAANVSGNQKHCSISMRSNMLVEPNITLDTQAF